VNAAKKHMGSTEAMQISVKTSKLLKYRADHIVPGVMSSMRDAILHRDFDQFAELTMKVCETECTECGLFTVINVRIVN